MTIQPTLFADDLNTAYLSPCRRYRYWLRRFTPYAGPMRTCNWLMLNPSTADESADDPTIRRCISFAYGWGYAAIVVTNLFAFRATDPKDMRAAADPIGLENDDCIVSQARQADLVVTAWGTSGKHMGRGASVLRMLREAGVVPRYLSLTASGEPGHPLYLRGDLKPIAWDDAGR